MQKESIGVHTSHILQQVGGAHESLSACAHSRVCMLEQQTAKMAEGPDPGQTLPKCEFSSTFEMRKEKISSYNLSKLTLYNCVCYEMFLFLNQQLQPRPL